MKQQHRSSGWLWIGVCLMGMSAGGCGRDAVTSVSQPQSGFSETNARTSALFEEGEDLSAQDAAEILAAIALPLESRSTSLRLQVVTQLLLGSERVAPPISSFPSLANADVAQPAGELTLADVAVVLAAAQPPSEPLTDVEIAARVQQLLGNNANPSNQFSPEDVRVIPGIEQLGDPGQPGGLAFDDGSTVVQGAVDAIDQLPASVNSGTALVFPLGTTVTFPLAPASQQTLTLSFNPPLTAAGTTEGETFSAAQLGCPTGNVCSLAGLPVIPASDAPQPDDYEVTYTFRLTNGGLGRVKRFVTVTEPGIAPLPDPQTGVPLVVNSFEDVIDPTDGLVTLREAIVAANTDTLTELNQAGSGADVIELPAGTFALTLEGADEDAAETGDLDIASDITLRGTSAEAVSIVGLGAKEGATTTDRVFHVLSNSNLTLESITIAEGAISNESSSHAAGGGIFVSRDATATLIESTVSGNSAMEEGGGIFGDREATLTLDNSTIANNIAGSGGGIYGQILSAVNITGSTISNNTATAGSGGGIGSSDAAIAVLRSAVTGNTASASGGGIFGQSVDLPDTDVTVNVTESTIADNIAGGTGGGMRMDGVVNVTNSTITNNSASSYGGGLFLGGRLNISGSTIDRNGVTSKYGGGVFINVNSTATLANSTVADNTAIRKGGGLENRGNTKVTNSTISHNQAQSVGGGIATSSNVLTLESTIVTGNTALANPNLYQSGSSGRIDALDSALGSDIDEVNGTNRNTITGDLKLDPAGLQNNGGLTQTIGLQATSPAIDAGSNPLNLTTDQRGMARTVGGGTDIGAFEFVP